MNAWKEERTIELISTNTWELYLHKVGGFLEQSDVLRVLAGPHLNVPSLEVEPDLELEVLHHGLEYLHPVLLEWRVSVSRHRDLPHLAPVSKLLPFDWRKCSFSLREK